MADLQAGDEFIHQHRLQIVRESAVDGQSLEAAVPGGDVLVGALLGVVEVGAFAENGNLGRELLSKDLRELHEWLIFGQHWVAQVSKGFVCLNPDARDQKGRFLLFVDSIDDEELVEDLRVCLPVVRVLVKSWNGSDYLLLRHFSLISVVSISELQTILNENDENAGCFICRRFTLL